jgi:hypothetical protein
MTVPQVLRIAFYGKFLAMSQNWGDSGNVMGLSRERQSPDWHHPVLEIPTFLTRTNCLQKQG